MDSIKTEIVVVGAGPGGYAAAFYAADLGKKVILIEKEKKLGGVCLNRGCIPSKALLYATHQIVNARESAHRGITFTEPTLDLSKLRAWKESILEKLAGGITTLAKMRGVPFYCVKGISDGPSDQLPDFNSFISHNGQFLLARFILLAVLHPGYWPALMRMGENSRKAARNIAQSLLNLLDERGSASKRNGYPNHQS